MNVSGFCIKLVWGNIALMTLHGCQKVNDIDPPVAKIGLFPTKGDTSTFFCFDGSGSSDNISETWQLKFQWDFNSDGTWDTDLSFEPKFVWRFATYGKKVVTVNVVDKAGTMGQTICTLNIAPNFDDTTFTDARDGNEYRALRIDNTWWMAENLRFGVEIPLGTIPADNGIVEKFIYRDSMGRSITQSGYYNWNEATYYGKSIPNGICPPGWRLLKHSDIGFLFNRFASYIYSDFIFKPDGYLGIGFYPEGFYSLFDNSFSYFGDYGFWIVGLNASSDDPFEHDFMVYHKSEFGIGAAYSNNPDVYGYEWWNKERWGIRMDFNKLAVNVRCIKNVN